MTQEWSPERFMKRSCSTTSINNTPASILPLREREDIAKSLPMLDLKLTRKDNRIETDIYHKPTLTDQYLQWTSPHPVQQKLGIVRTLMHHADTLISDVGRRERKTRSEGL